VLVDDKGRCVISDFGQSEMKWEASRRSGKSITSMSLPSPFLSSYIETPYRWDTALAGTRTSEWSHEADASYGCICVLHLLH
jgi:hypothetical protein